MQWMLFTWIGFNLFPGKLGFFGKKWRVPMLLAKSIYCYIVSISCASLLIFWDVITLWSMFCLPYSQSEYTNWKECAEDNSSGGRRKKYEKSCDILKCFERNEKKSEIIKATGLNEAILQTLRRNAQKNNKNKQKCYKIY